jgi:hypothetical protein
MTDRQNFIGCKERDVNRHGRRKTEKKKRVADGFSKEIHRQVVERFPGGVDDQSRNDNTRMRLYALMKTISTEILTIECPGCRVSHAEWVLKQANKIADAEHAVLEEAMALPGKTMT